MYAQQHVLDTGAEVGPAHEVERVAMLAESGDRCRNRRRSDSETFVGLDWIQTLRKRGHAMRNDDDIRVLQVGRNISVRSGAKKIDVRLSTKKSSRLGSERVRADEDDTRPRQVSREVTDQLDIESSLVEGASVKSDQAVR